MSKSTVIGACASDIIKHIGFNHVSNDLRKYIMKEISGVVLAAALDSRVLEEASDILDSEGKATKSGRSV